ncbi:MAG: NAD(P)-dependent oxidoreductase [Erysipelotrichaceae bacterium]|nr:NAD(P)-dependent oxidoreductase [Erysipelotrichaceae bacterium]
MNYVISEAERCLNCKNPFCSQGCPIHTPIPQVIKLFKENKLNEAGQLLFDNNPLSLVTSLVCNHANQCEGHCIQGRKNSAIHISDIEHYISDTYFDKMKIHCEPYNGHMIAIIGSGPAGITVAIIMAKKGYKVTIFESKDKIGGVMQYGIPEFRLPRTIMERYKKKLTEIGVSIRPNTTIGGALEIGNLLEDGYEAIFIGTGVWRPKKLGVRGESLGNVHFGIDYLASPSAFNLGNRVAIIGTGNTAMDVARTALRHGVEHVTIYSHNNRLSASLAEIDYARLDGCEFEYDLETLEFNERGPVFKKAVRDEKDEIIGYEENPVQIECDSVIICVSQGPKNKLILTTPGLQGNDKGLLITEETGMTTVEGLFAAGDVVSGANTIVQAVAKAKVVAEQMDEYVKNKNKAD